MSTSKILAEQFLTLYVFLGDVVGELSDAQYEEQRALQSGAYALMRERESKLPGRTSMQDDIEVCNYELCEDDVELRMVAEKTAWGMGFYSGKAFEPATCKALREAVMAAYSDAAEALARPAGSVRFVCAERQSVFRVTETEEFDVDAACEVAPAV